MLRVTMQYNVVSQHSSRTSALLQKKSKFKHRCLGDLTHSSTMHEVYTTTAKCQLLFNSEFLSTIFHSSGRLVTQKFPYGHNVTSAVVIQSKILFAWPGALLNTNHLLALIPSSSLQWLLVMMFQLCQLSNISTTDKFTTTKELQPCTVCKQ